MSSQWIIRRSTADGKLGGVCSGIALRAGIDPVLVRIAMALLALSAGVGLVLYAAAWFFVPDEYGRAPVDEHLPAARHWPRGLLIAGLVLACVAVAGLLSPLMPFGLGPALVLAAVWYFGFYRPRHSKQVAHGGPQPPVMAPPPAPAAPAAPPTASPAPSASPALAAPWPTDTLAAPWPTTTMPTTTMPTTTMPTTTMPTAPAMPTAAAAPSQPPVPEFADQERARFFSLPDPVGLYTASATAVAVPAARRPAALRLRLVSLVALGLTLAGLGLADALGAAIALPTYLAAALLIGGLTLVAAAWFGRARGILPVTVLVGLATLASTAAGPVAHLSDWSDRDQVYLSQSQLPRADTLPGGRLLVDLSGLPVTRDQTYEASVGTGELELIRPPGSNVAVQWSVGSGMAIVPGGSGRGGRHQSGVIPASGVQPGDPVLTVRVHVDRGRLEVR